LVLAVVLVKSADGEHGLLRPLLEFAVLITSLQIGYVFGLVSHSMSERGGTTAAPAPLRGHRWFNTSRGLKAPSPTASVISAGSSMGAPVLDEIGAPPSIPAEVANGIKSFRCCALPDKRFDKIRLRDEVALSSHRTSPEVAKQIALAQKTFGSRLTEYDL
jgi:hypothetical protein